MSPEPRPINPYAPGKARPAGDWPTRGWRRPLAVTGWALMAAGLIAMLAQQLAVATVALLGPAMLRVVQTRGDAIFMAASICVMAGLVLRMVGTAAAIAR